VIDATSLTKYPNHFSPAGMDLFALRDDQVEQHDYWSLIGVAGADLEPIRALAKRWLTDANPTDPATVSRYTLHR